MFLGDKGKPSKFSNVRMNYDIIIDNERMTLQKLSQKLGFYTVLFEKKIKEMEIVYDTEKNLLSGAGLLLRKKISPSRVYFSLVRISSMGSAENREKKSFLGECELKDQPSNFPVQIAEEINKIFNNVFTINLVEIVKHCAPYIKIEMSGNRYKIVSGTGYEAEMAFETLKIRDMRTGRKAIKRNFSLKLDNNPNYKKEREHILDTIDRYCKELFLLKRSRFEIAEVAVKVPQPKETPTDAGKKKDEDNKDDKNKKKK